MELQDRSRLYPSLSPQGGLIMGSDGRLHYAQLQNVPSAPPAPPAPPAPSAPSAPLGYIPIPPQGPQIAPMQMSQASYPVISGPVFNSDAVNAQASLNCWSRWVKIFSALLLAINIAVNIGFFVDLAYPSENSHGPCKFYIIARVIFFILLTVTARAGLKASRLKTSQSAKCFIKMLVFTGVFILVVVGMVSYRRMRKFRRDGEWDGRRHHGRDGERENGKGNHRDRERDHEGRNRERDHEKDNHRERDHEGKKLSESHDGIDKNFPPGGRVLGSHDGIDKNFPPGGRVLGDHDGIDKNFPPGGRVLGSHDGIDKNFPPGGRVLGSHDGIDKNFPPGGRVLGDRDGIDKNFPSGGRVLKNMINEELIHRIRVLGDRDDYESDDYQPDSSSSIGSETNSNNWGRHRKHNGHGKHEGRDRDDSWSNSDSDDADSSAEREDEKDEKEHKGRGEHEGRNRNRHEKKLRGNHHAICCVAGFIIYSLLMFLAIKLYRAAKNYESIAQRGNVPMVPVMHNQPVLAYAPGMNPLNIPVGSPIRH